MLNTPDLYPHHEDRPDCRDSQGNSVAWHACEHCGECHITDCQNCVEICDVLRGEMVAIEQERRAENAWSQVAR